jgi:hypothetical protein
MGARVMDVQPCRRFFLDPQLTFHRRYEALRAFFVENRPVAEIASRFGYKPTALKLVLDSTRLVFDVSPFAMERESCPSKIPGATPSAILTLNTSYIPLYSW